MNKNKNWHQKLVEQRSPPSSGAGFSSLGPGNTFRGGTGFANLQALVIENDQQDDEANGGRDSNGYVYARYYSPDWFAFNDPATGSTLAPKVRISDQTNEGGNNNHFAFASGDVVIGMQFGITKNSPNFEDDGYPLFIPLTDSTQFVVTAPFPEQAYPGYNDDCQWFPAKLVYKVSKTYNSSICLQGIDSFPDVYCVVNNIANRYIPAGVSLICQGVGPGDPTPNNNDYPAYVTRYEGSDIFLSVVSTEMPKFGDPQTGVVDILGTDLVDTGITQAVVNTQQYTYGVGVISPIVHDPIKDKWYPINNQQVFFGTVSSTSITRDTMGDIHITDDRNNSTFTQSCRAFTNLVRSQEVWVVYDYVQAENVAIPLNLPLIGIANAAIAMGATGTVNVKTSKLVDPAAGATSLTAYATFAALQANQQVLVWWDYYEKQFFAAPVGGNANLIGKWTGTDLAANATGTFDLFDDQRNALGTTQAGVRAFILCPQNSFSQLYWDTTNNEYYAIPIPTFVQTMVTAWQYDTSTHKFQIKTRDIQCIPNGAESGWTDAYTAVEIPQVVREVSWDGVNTLADDYTEAVYVLEKGTEVNGNVIDVAGSC